jgi:hypothetical protein
MCSDGPVWLTELAISAVCPDTKNIPLEKPTAINVERPVRCESARDRAELASSSFHSGRKMGFHS